MMMVMTTTRMYLAIIELMIDALYLDISRTALRTTLIRLMRNTKHNQASQEDRQGTRVFGHSGKT